MGIYGGVVCKGVLRCRVHGVGWFRVMSTSDCKRGWY